MSWAQDTKFRFQVFALIAMFGCPGFLIWMAAQTKRQIASSNWPSVEGEIQDITAKSWWSEDSKTTKYYGRAIYSYTVQDHEYTSDLTDLGPGTKRADPNTALADVARYQPGMKLPVYYDPNDPSVGILEKGIPPIHLGLLIGLSVGTIVSVIVSFFTIRGWIKGKKHAEINAE